MWWFVSSRNSCRILAAVIKYEEAFEMKCESIFDHYGAEYRRYAENDSSLNFNGARCALPGHVTRCASEGGERGEEGSSGLPSSLKAGPQAGHAT